MLGNYKTLDGRLETRKDNARSYSQRRIMWSLAIELDS